MINNYKLINCSLTPTSDYDAEKINIGGARGDQIDSTHKGEYYGD